MVVPLAVLFFEKIVGSIRSYIALKKAEKETDQSTQAIVDKIDAATSSDQKKEAVEDAIKKF